MGQQAPPNNQRRPLVLFLFHFLLFSYPLLSLLWRRSYPIVKAEVGILLLLIVLLSILLAFILKNVRPAIANVLSTLLVAIVLMLQFNLLLPGLIVCIVLGLWLTWMLGTHFQLYALPVVFALLIGSYFDSYKDDGIAPVNKFSPHINKDLPPVVHILLDSFIGIDGLPPYDESVELKSQIYSFLEDYNFQVFPRAYSRYLRTGDSLYSAMNFKHDGFSEFELELFTRRSHVMKTNAEFDVMENLGYSLNIYQTGHMDFCQSNPDMIERCWQYAQPNVASIEQASSIKMRVRMLLQVVVTQSALVTDLIKFTDLMGEQGIGVHDPEIFSTLKHDLTNGADGRFYFAHVLLPHSPFAFRPDCSINYNTPVWVRSAMAESDNLSSHQYKERTMAYFGQVYCALNSLSLLFEAMKTNGVFEKAIIVIHGDHGSLIGKNLPEYNNRNILESRDYRAHFSTLFAVKVPGQSGKVDERALSLGTLLEAFSELISEYVSHPEYSAEISGLISTEPQKLEPYIYLLGTMPLHRVNGDISSNQD